MRGGRVTHAQFYLNKLRAHTVYFDNQRHKRWNLIIQRSERTFLELCGTPHPAPTGRIVQVAAEKRLTDRITLNL